MDTHQHNSDVITKNRTYNMAPLGQNTIFDQTLTKCCECLNTTIK